MKTLPNSSPRRLRSINSIVGYDSHTNNTQKQQNTIRSSSNNTTNLRKKSISKTIPKQTKSIKKSISNGHIPISNPFYPLRKLKSPTHSPHSDSDTSIENETVVQTEIVSDYTPSTCSTDLDSNSIPSHCDASSINIHDITNYSELQIRVPNTEFNSKSKIKSNIPSKCTRNNKTKTVLDLVPNDCCPIPDCESNLKKRTFYEHQFMNHFRTKHNNIIPENVKTQFKIVNCPNCQQLFYSHKIDKHLKTHEIELQNVNPTIFRSNTAPIQVNSAGKRKTPTKKSKKFKNSKRNNKNKLNILNVSPTKINFNRSTSHPSIGDRFQQQLQNRNTETIDLTTPNLNIPTIESVETETINIPNKNSETVTATISLNSMCGHCNSKSSSDSLSSNLIQLPCKHIYHKVCFHMFTNNCSNRTCKLCDYNFTGIKYIFNNCEYKINETDRTLSSRHVPLGKHLKIATKTTTPTKNKTASVIDTTNSTLVGKDIVPISIASIGTASPIRLSPSIVNSTTASVPPGTIAIPIPIPVVVPPIPSPIATSSIPNFLPISFHKPCRIWKKVPFSCRAIFLASVEATLIEFIKSINDPSLAHMRDQYIIQLLELPRKLLVKPNNRGGKKAVTLLRRHLAKEHVIILEQLQLQEQQRIRAQEEAYSEALLGIPIDNTTSSTIDISTSTSSSIPSIAPVVIDDMNEPTSILESDATIKKIVRATQLARDGHLSKATQSLVANAPAEINDNTVERLITLHPTSNSFPAHVHKSIPTPNDMNRWNEAIMTIDAELLKKLPKRFIDNGSCAGIDGWNGNILNTLIQFGNDTIIQGIADLLNLIVNGQLEGDVRQLLLTSILIPLKKKDSGIRPLAIGSIFTRLAGKLCISELQKDSNDAFQHLFPKVQLGLGKSGGPEIALHKIQSLLQLHPNYVVLSTDVKNAFNSISRSIISEQLQKHRHELDSTSIIRLFHWSHYTDSTLLVYGQHSNSNIQVAPISLSNSILMEQSSSNLSCDRQLIQHAPELKAILNSSVGVRQGDSIASFAFALGIQHTYEQLQSKFPNVHFVAIHDDLTIIGDPMESLKAYKYFQQLLVQRGDLQLQPPKCQLLIPTNEIVQADMNMDVETIKTQCELEQIQFINTGCLSLLGGVIGDNDLQCQLEIEKKVNSQKILFEYIEHKAMSVQIAYHLLRTCLIPRMNYLCRVTRPDLILKYCKQFDSMILHALQTKINYHCNFSMNQETQLKLPIRLGGLGLTCSVDISPIAYFSSFALATINLPAIDTNSALYRTIKDCHTAILSSGVTPNNRIKDNLEEALLEYRQADSSVNKLQHFITQQIHQHNYDNLLIQMNSDVDSNEFTENIDMHHRATLISSSADGASTIFNTLPSQPEYILNDTAMSIAIRSRLQIVPRNDMIDNTNGMLKDTIICGLCSKSMLTIADTCSHSHTCVVLKGTAITTRHNFVLQTLVKLCREVGYVTTLEPAHRGARNARLRPDATCISSSPTVESILIDVSVIHTSSNSYVLTDGQTSFACTDKREKLKIQKYQPIADKEKMKVVPLIIESTGAFGRQFAQIIRDLARQAEKARVSSERDFYHHTRSLVAFALHRGNAFMFEQFIPRVQVSSISASTRTFMNSIAIPSSSDVL
jgi:hypothetical protein